MIARPIIRRISITSMVVVALSACSNPKPVGKDGLTPTFEWDLVAVPSASNDVHAHRTVDLTGGGQLDMSLTCNYRPSSNPNMNGFWLKLELHLQSSDGALGLDPLASSEQSVQFADVRSDGEAGGMTFSIIDQTHYVYENNQTNALNQDNNDPTAVEVGQKFDIPLNDGRTVSIDMRKSDAGYQALMKACKPFGADQGSANNLSTST